MSACEQNFREIFMKNPILKLPLKEIVSGDFLALTFFVNKNKDTHNTSSHSLALNSQILQQLFFFSFLSSLIFTELVLFFKAKLEFFVSFMPYMCFNVLGGRFFNVVFTLVIKKIERKKP